MVKIGLICWQQGGGTNDYILKKPMKPWKKGLKTVQKGTYKGKIPFEKALIAAMEYQYDDVEIMFINKFDEKKLKQNDINFLVSLNLLYAWEKNDKEYKRVYKLMDDPSINFYPNLKEQMFLYNKGEYLEYYEEKGIPIAPTFIIKGDRNVRRIIQKVEDRQWKSFVLKPHYAYANCGIGKFDTEDPNVKNKVAKFLTKNKQFPGFVCQEVMEGFAKFWEVKTFWINGKYEYYVAMKASSAVFDADDISDDGDYGTISPSLLKQLKKMGQKVVDHFPKHLNTHSNPPLYLRIDFGCCKGNSLDGKSYFLNEIEYAGCAIFAEESGLDNFAELWAEAYYKKAKEYETKESGPKKSEKSTRVKRNLKRTIQRKKRQTRRITKRLTKRLTKRKLVPYSVRMRRRLRAGSRMNPSD